MFSVYGLYSVNIRFCSISKKTMALFFFLDAYRLYIRIFTTLHWETWVIMLLPSGNGKHSQDKFTHRGLMSFTSLMLQVKFCSQHAWPTRRDILHGCYSVVWEHSIQLITYTNRGMFPTEVGFTSINDSIGFVLAHLNTLTSYMEEMSRSGHHGNM